MWRPVAFASTSRAATAAASASRRAPARRSTASSRGSGSSRIAPPAERASDPARPTRSGSASAAGSALPGGPAGRYAGGVVRLSPLQRLVVDQLRDRSRSRDLLVSAGAGSGKTLVLVESVLAALEAGVPLDRILVVTFTDKAAAEMKGRIDRALDRSPTLAALRPHLPQAWISTIDSFCLRLLRERFDSVGIDPRFRVLSQEDADLMLEESLTRVFHEEYEKARGRADEGAPEKPRFEILVDMCGFDERGERLRGVVRRLLRYARTSKDPGEFLPGHLERMRRKAERWEDLPWREEYAARIDTVWNAGIGLLRILTELLEEAGHDSAPFADLLAALETVDAATLHDPVAQRAALEKLRAAGVVDAEQDRIEIGFPALPRGSGEEFKKLKELVQDLLRSDWIAEMPLDPERVCKDENEVVYFALALIRLTQQVWMAYDTAKERAGALDFADLEGRALRLLQARGESGGDPIRFDRVFVDEYQDINGLQHRILSSVADPEALFRVGDVKQSIYQFRLAEPGIIRSLASARTEVRDPGAIADPDGPWNVLLSANYRSLPPVLDFANRIAEGLFLPGEIGGPYGPQALIGEATIEGDPPPAEILLAERPDDDEGDAESARRAEHAAIAKRIRQLLDEEALVRDPDTKQLRPVEPGDVAILLRARTAAPDLARRLEEEGIAASLGDDDPFFEAQEVRDLMRILYAVDNLLDDVSLAAALRSPAFHWTDTDLLACRLAYPRATRYAYCLAGLAAEGGDSEHDEPIAARVLPADPAEREPLLGARAALPDGPPFASLARKASRDLARFLEWREAAGGIELPELIARILDETHLLRSAAAMPGGLRRRANLRKLLGISRRYARESGHDLHRFLHWLEALEQGGARISVAPVAAESLPAVRILTVHAAKGLEFPVVFLADTSRRFGGGRTVPVVPGRALLGVRLFDREAFVYRKPHSLRLLEAEQRLDELAEEKRVLYVALTRARDRLIVSGVDDGKEVVSATFREAYRAALGRDDAEASAMRETILAKKARPLEWIDLALGVPLRSEDSERRGAAGLPLTIRRMPAPPEIERPAAGNRIHALRPRLLRLEPVDPSEAADDGTV
ncbi:MAG: AAA family ATPase, partial [Candidatus Eisenbacteria bacterium]|nr:AAA family ATPase [Candidatus Latescibacterota bacterium]MBD3301164.1 AAA family ATPase [Candidatus Eisenbacteria bacterium]